VTVATSGQGAELTGPVSGPIGTAKPRHNIPHQQALWC